MEWYNIFSYWGFGAWFAWLMGAPIQPLSIILINIIFSIFFVLTKYNGFPPVALFILFIHTLPLYSLRSSKFDLSSFVYIYMVYMVWLYAQGLTPMKVYESILDEPPVTIRDYLQRRGLKTRTV